MFDYIKKVSLALSFITQRLGEGKEKMKNILEDLAYDLLFIAQKFKTENYNLEDLKKLEEKVVYLVDVLDFARVNNLVSPMNSKIFIETQTNFLKHIYNLIEQKNNPSTQVWELKNLEDFVSRKVAKDKLQSNYFPPVDLLKKEISQPEVAEALPEKLENLETTFGSLEIVEKEISTRRDRILKALMNGGGSIKEISAKLHDVAEKTIQRDLLELMRDKKVIMLGKKRWAKYYLK